MNDIDELRDKILNEIKPLVASDIEDESEKFDALIKIIQFGNTKPELYNKAYDTAIKIEDDNEKKEALMTLLDLIDTSSGDSIDSKEGDF